MRIGDLARVLGVSPDTIRFYERQGWLPRPARSDNRYRAYDPADVEHLRLLLELRRLDVPLPDAARLAAWCHAGHCGETTSALPTLIAERRRSVAERIAGLRALDERLARLERHLATTGRRATPRSSGRPLPVVAAAEPCCDAAGAVEGLASGCSCCGTVPT
jgi:DNA-binding transcriptional MerR regulator